MTGWQAVVKRAADLVGALVLGVLTLPALVIALVLTKLLDRGAPAIYTQDRVGQGGQVFTVYKVRTMVPDAERDSGPVFSMDGDTRVTPLGRWLRRFYIDELPQLWNVLRGEMSLIGPRPERPFFVEQFKAEVPGYERRLVAKPGLSGMAQVRNVADVHCAHKKLAYDLEYIDNYSLWLDVRLAFETACGALLNYWPSADKGQTEAEPDEQQGRPPERPVAQAEDRPTGARQSAASTGTKASLPPK